MNLHCIYKQESEMVSVKAIIAMKYEAKYGPFHQCLSRALVKLNIDRQAYHGGTFVGNRVNKF